MKSLTLGSERKVIALRTSSARSTVAMNKLALALVTPQVNQIQPNLVLKKRQRASIFTLHFVKYVVFGVTTGVDP